MPVVVTGGALIGRSRPGVEDPVDGPAPRRPAVRCRGAAVAARRGRADRVRARQNARARCSSLSTLDSAETLTKGELAVTQGSANSLFPKGLAVGTVTRKVERGHRDATARAAEAGRRPRPSRSREGAPLLASTRAVIRYLRLALVVITAVVLQTTLFTHLRIDGVAPDVGLVCVLAVAYEDGPDTGAWFGFVMGLSIDLFLTTPLGLSALAYALTGYAVGCSRRAWSARRRAWRRSSASSAVSSAASCSSPSGRSWGRAASSRSRA